MENCKFCGAELKEDSTICPACGKDNAVTEEIEKEAVPVEETPVEAAVPAAEETDEVPETKEAEKKSPVKAALAVISVLAVVALLVAMIVGGSKKTVPDATPEDVLEELAETVEATIPADGNPDDETCKGSYTAEDDAVIAAHDVVIATAGENQLTLGQLQVHYWMEVRNFLNNYGAYAAYFGLDYQQPLDTQMCGVTDTPMTWQQYFLGAALSAWHTQSSMASEAVKAGFELKPEFQQFIDGTEEELDDGAKQNGLESADDLLHRSLGGAVTVDDYKQFITRYYYTVDYINHIQEENEPTEEMLEAFFKEHQNEYEDNGLTQEDVYVNVRHILVIPAVPEGAEEADEAAWAEAEKKAQEIYQQWQDGEMTEDSFAALAGEHSEDPGSKDNGGLYTDVSQGQMVETFDAWCFDPARQIGDHGIVKTNYGYHIMFFSGSRPLWVDYARSDFLQEKSDELIKSALEKYPQTVNYSDILLSKVNLGV